MLVTFVRVVTNSVVDNNFRCKVGCIPDAIILKKSGNAGYFTSDNGPDGIENAPTIHLQGKSGYGRGQYPGLLCKCIVGCVFNSIGLVITRKIPCTLKR
jgi:hypothetical protein